MLSTIALTSLLAVGTFASPFKRQDTTYTINVINNCPNDLTLGVFMLSSDGGQPTETAGPVVAGANGGTAQLAVDYMALKQRLSTMDVGNQYVDQSLFEFGYGSAGGQYGTAYDLSLFGESTPTMQVVPANTNCQTKICNAGNGYPVDQCWTNENQSMIGSPADTGCYVNAPTDFTVTYCV